jgi:general secretion pathway protein G
MNIRPRGDYRAFTLIELVIVVIIIGVLVAMVTPRLMGRTESARCSVAKTEIELNIPSALKMYEFDNGALPGTADGLSALIAAPGQAKNWKGPYLEKEPKDPWGNPYHYASPGIRRKDYDLSSYGKDGVESGDDIVNWQ